MSCPTLALDRSNPSAPPAPATPQPPAPPEPDPATDVLAAIASTYEEARAGIISGERSSAVDPSADVPSAVVPAGYSPTVPLTLVSQLRRAEPGQDSPTGALQALTGAWSRLRRRAEPARRPRHSATGAEAAQWGPPGRVRYRPSAASPVT